MKLAVSNIAWTAEEEVAVAEKLQELGVQYVEIAPTKQWETPTTPTPEDVQKYKDFWNSYGIEVVAFQSMLFNQPDLKIFETAENRKETLEYLKQYIDLAHSMGVQRMVFGSPKNRQKGDLDAAAATAIATDFFNELGDHAQQKDVIFCIEPNAKDYACDFVTTAQAGIDLVKRVGNPGFGLHLDAACMALAGDDLAASITAAGSLMKHFHISSPMLGLVEDREDVDHRAAAKALHDTKYQGFVSIEMRPGDAGSNLERVESAVRFTQSVYN